MSCTIYEPFTNDEKVWVQTNMAANVLLGLLEVSEDENKFLEEADEDVILFSPASSFTKRKLNR